MSKNEIIRLRNKIHDLNSDNQERCKSILDIIKLNSPIHIKTGFGSGFTQKINNHSVDQEILRVIEENNREISICERQIKTLQKKKMSKESIKIQIDIDRYKNKIIDLKNKIQTLEEDSIARYKSVQDMTVSFELTQEALRVIDENNLERNRILGQIKTIEKRINYKKEDLLLLRKREILKGRL